MAYEWLIGIVIFAFIVMASSIKVVKEYERGVIFRLGRLVGARGPGLFLIIPIFEVMVKIDLRVSVFDVTPQEIMSPRK
jgi:regulator of protease activity HflC (stomatin/prohibitin superfamily)